MKPDRKAPADLLPPQNLEAEQGVIGSVLLDNSVFPDVLGELSCEDFFRDSHQRIFGVMVELRDQGRPVDPITLTEEMRRRDLYEDEDFDYLGEVVAAVPHAANARYYAQIVRQKSIARALVEGSEEVIRRAYSNELTADQLLAVARARVEEAESSASSWETPDLDDAPPATPFPLDVFPDGLARLVTEAAETFPCPPDFLAVPCLAAASAAIGRSVALAVKDSWVESALLYLAFCAPPGSIKSESLKVAVNPLFEIQRNELYSFMFEKEAFLERERFRKTSGATGPPEKMPPLRRLLVDDATTERLTVLLAENPRGLLMAADELTAWIAGMNQYKSGGNDRQFYLKVYTGASITRDRTSQEDGLPIIVPHPFLTVCGAITPAKLPSLAGDGSDDGFVDRILLSYPDPVRVRFNTEPLSEAAQSDWSDAVGRLYARPIIPDDRGGFRPFLVRLTPQALAEYGAWFNAHCDETMDPDFPAHLKGPWAKMRGQCVRLALVLDSLWWAYDPAGPSDIPGNVDVQTVRRAFTLMEYFKAHARRCHHAIRGERGGNEDAAAILEWARRRPTGRFSVKEAKDCFRRRFASSPNGLEDALAWLSGRRAVRKLAAPARPKGGRIGSDVYEVHASLLKSARETRETSSNKAGQ